MSIELFEGDCRVVLADMAGESISAIVTDPPYGDFLGTGSASHAEWEAWDSTGVTFDPVVWSQCLRVAKPGAWLLAFSATRIVHRLAVAIEDARWDIRGMLAWAYATGQVKSPKLPGGIGSSLKPAWEPIIMARKPFQGSLRDLVATTGMGGLRIQETEIPAPDKEDGGRWPTDLVATDAVFGDHYDRIFLIPKPSPKEKEGNPHPTVKPVDLMRHLVRLVTPEGGTVLDPFCGSGSTLVAARYERLDGVGIDITPGYLDYTEERLRGIHFDDLPF